MRLLDPARRADAVRLLQRGLGAEPQLAADPSALSVRVEEAERAAGAVAELARAAIGLAGFSLVQPSLDEVFLGLTGHPADDGAGETAETAAA